MISIKGLKKADVLHVLWSASKSQGVSFMQLRPASHQDCKRALAHCSYIDYFCGRVIKCEFGEDELDPRLYDQDNGEGAAERAISVELLHHGDEEEAPCS